MDKLPSDIEFGPSQDGGLQFEMPLYTIVEMCLEHATPGEVVDALINVEGVREALRDAMLEMALGDWSDGDVLEFRDRVRRQADATAAHILARKIGGLEQEVRRSSDLRRIIEDLSNMARHGAHMEEFRMRQACLEADTRASRIFWGHEGGAAALPWHLGVQYWENWLKSALIERPLWVNRESGNRCAVVATGTRESSGVWSVWYQFLGQRSVHCLPQREFKDRFEEVV